MVRAYHSIFCAYGFWLPNDPRGSWSDFVRSWELLHHGQPTKVHTRASLTNKEHDRERRLKAKRDLRYPAVVFTGRQAKSIAKGFARAAEESRYHILACSILPAHVHLVIGRSHRKIEQVVGHLKARATQQLKSDGLHPLAAFADADGVIPSPWSRLSWNVFLNRDARIENAIRYVQDNPVREGKCRQRWSFVSAVEPSHD